MATFSLTNSKIWHGDVDITSYATTVSVEGVHDALDVTTFGDEGWRNRKAGLGDYTLSAAGFVDGASADPEDELFTGLGVARVFTVCADEAEEGDAAYFGEYQMDSIRLFDAVGTVAPFQVKGSSQNPYGLVSGVVNAAKSSRTGTTTSTGEQLGAVAAGERLYAAVHVFSGSGTMDVIINSDDNSGFTSPVLAITFDQFTGPGSQFASVAGAITDDWFRAKFTVGSGTWSVAVVTGIR